MLQIKTIAQKANEPEEFDKEVNAALAEGWELVRRDVLPETSNWHRCFYAELEREITVEEEEEPEADGTAEWLFSRRNPLEPYHCSNCGHAANPRKPLPNICPNCCKNMIWRAE